MISGRGNQKTRSSLRFYYLRSDGGGVSFICLSYVVMTFRGLSVFRARKL